MNSFTLMGVGNLLGNPEIIARGSVPCVRFCLVGSDGSEYGSTADSHRRAVACAWFVAFDEIADEIGRNAKEGDQLIVTARVTPHIPIDQRKARRWEGELIVTGFKYGAKKGGPGAVSTADSRAPRLPRQPATEAAAMTV